MLGVSTAQERQSSWPTPRSTPPQAIRTPSSSSSSQGGNPVSITPNNNNSSYQQQQHQQHQQQQPPMPGPQAIPIGGLSNALHRTSSSPYSSSAPAYNPFGSPPSSHHLSTSAGSGNGFPLATSPSKSGDPNGYSFDSFKSFWHVPISSESDFKSSNQDESWRIVGSPPRKSYANAMVKGRSMSDSSWDDSKSFFGSPKDSFSGISRGFSNYSPSFEGSDHSLPIPIGGGGHHHHHPRDDMMNGGSKGLIIEKQPVSRNGWADSSSFSTISTSVSSNEWNTMASSPPNVSISPSSSPSIQYMTTYHDSLLGTSPVQNGLVIDYEGYLNDDDQPRRRSSRQTSIKEKIKRGEGVYRFFRVEFKSGRSFVHHIEKDKWPNLKVGDYVIVEADRGRDLGRITDVEEMPDRESKAIYRLARYSEVLDLQNKVSEESKTLALCQSKTKQRKLPMEVVDAEYQWDRKKLTYYFVADRRIDFRELVRELFKVYKTRIWMCSVDESRANEIRIRSPQSAALASNAILHVNNYGRDEDIPDDIMDDEDNFSDN